MKEYGRVEAQLHSLFTSGLDERMWLSTCPDSFARREKNPGNHRIEGWVGPTAGLDVLHNRKFNVQTKESVQAFHFIQ